MVITVEECRKILNDFSSTEEEIKKRIEYIEALCRNMAKLELENYVNEAKNRTKRQKQPV